MSSIPRPCPTRSNPKNDNEQFDHKNGIDGKFDHENGIDEKFDHENGIDGKEGNGIDEIENKSNSKQNSNKKNKTKKICQALNLPAIYNINPRSIYNKQAQILKFPLMWKFKISHSNFKFPQQ